MFLVLLTAALADEPPVSRSIDPRFLPQSSEVLPQGALQERDPVTHPF